MFLSRFISRNHKNWFKRKKRNLREWWYSLQDVGFASFFLYQVVRKSGDYTHVYSKESPLVSVCVATYNRSSLLIQRSISSLINQTYSNIEIIVVGDACTDDTFECLEKIKDSRLRCVNLDERGVYPENPLHRWMVAGTKPLNHALTMCKGDFVTHLDDDDEFALDRIEKLVDYIKKSKADIVWHPFNFEDSGGQWACQNSEYFEFQNVSTSSVFYHSWFTRIQWDINSWRRDEPGDWSRFRKFKFLGVKACRYPESLLFHYRERNQSH